MLSFFKSSAARCSFFVSIGITLCLAQIALAQVSLTGSSYTQNFNGIGNTAAVSLPSGWKVNANTFGSASGSTGAAAGTSGTGILTGSSGGNIYNLANGVTASSTDRAVGILNSGSFTSGKCIHFAVTNNTGSTITAFNISFDYEKYRSGTRAWTWTLDAGTDGSTYGTSLSAGTEAYAGDGNNTTISNPPTTVSKTVSITGLTLTNGSTYYLRWTLTGTGGSSNGQAIGIDNFSLEACITPAAQTVTGGGGYCSGASGVAIGLSGSESGVDYQLYNGASAVGSAVSGTGSSFSFGTFTATGTYTVVGSRFTGCSANMTGSAVVSVNALPTARTVTGGGAYCSGGSGVAVGLSGSETGVHYQLYNGASTVGSPVPGTGSAISFGTQTTAATFTVAGTNTVTTCTQNMTGSADVTIDPLPTVNVTPSTASSCSDITASGADTYTWAPGIALSATTGATVSASPTVPTTYTVTGTSSLTCTSTATVTVTPASVALTRTSPATGNVAQGTNNHLLQTFNLAVTAADAYLTGLTVVTTGSYAGSDVNALKCWYSTSPTFSAGTATLVSTYTSPGSAGSKAFPSFTSQTISAGTTGYLHITVDIDGIATGGNTIALASTSFSGFGICSASLTGTDPVASSNTQTITAALCSGTPAAGTASPSPAVICGSGTSTLTLAGGASGTGLTYQWSSNSVNSSPGTPISGATNDTYTTGAVSSTTYYWCTTTCAASSFSNISAVGVVSVNAVPSSTGATNDGPICEGGSVTLSANSSDATAWDWTGPDGFTSTLQNPAATPTVTGTYSLTVSSTGSGCSPSTVYTTSVTVNPAPTSSGPSNDGPICVGGTVNLSANSSNATSWSWTGPSGFTSSLQNPAATPTATGTYSLMVSSSAGSGCSASTIYTTDVTVNAVPVSSGPTNSGPVCEGSSFTLMANTAGATSWSWTGPDGYTSTLQNPTASPTATATYSLTVSSAGSGCTPSTVYTTSVTVNSVPTISVTPPSGNSGVSLTASGGTTYTWSPSAGLSATTGATVTASPTVTTTYTVSGTTSGCTGTATALVNFAGGTVTWDFTPGTSGQATTSTNANLPASSCVASIGNSLGTVSTPINSTSASNNSGASGGNNIGNACKLGSFDNSTSSYINLILTPNTGYCLTVSDVDFGTRSTSTGAQAFTVSSDVAGFGTALATGSIANNSTWSAKTTSITPFTGDPSAAINVRIYGHSGAGSPGSGTINWRLDDIAVTYSVNPAPSLASASTGGAVCEGGTLSLFANTPTEVASYSWSGPGAFSSTLQNPSVSGATTAASGTYTVVVSNGAGCTRTYTTTATVNPLPSSTGATNNGPICVGGTVTLTANSSDANAWSWSGPSGFTSTLQNPTATPTVTGSYSLTLSNTTTGCSDATVYTTSVTVNAVPASSGATNDGPICVGGTVNLSANSTGATSWSWSGPSGYTSTLQNPTATPTTTGTYSLMVSSTGNGCSSSTVYTSSVTVNAVPTSSGATNDGPICVGGTVSLSANSTGATSWSWSGPAGYASTLQNPTAIPTTTGTYSLMVSSTGNGCSPATVYTTSVTVNDVPSSSGATNDGPICVGGTVNLSANSTGATSWSWSGPSGYASTLQNPTATPTTTGTYSLRVSSTGNGCSPSTVYTTSVNVNAVPTSSGATNDGPICVGGTVNLSANSTGATSWSWSGPAGYASTLQNPAATPTTTGTYSLVVSSTGNGCSPSTVYTTSVTVNAVPTSSGATNDGPICVGGTVNLSANSTGATSWSWSGPSGYASTLQNPTATPTTTGTYSLMVSSTGNGCSPSIVYTTSVTVNAVPTSTGATNDGPICVGGTVNLSANSTGATSWSWSGPSGYASTLQNPTATPTATGTYSLVVSSTGNGCSPSTVYTTSVTVNAVPTSSGATNDGPICVGGTVNLSANSTGATSWSWSGPSGYASTLQNPTATPTTTGTYSLMVSSTGNGCSPSTVYTTSVTVNSVPTSSGATNDGPICVGGTVNLSANSTGATSWSWSGPSGYASTLQNPTATPTTTGTYSLMVSSTGNGCSPSTVYTTSVTVNAVPTSSGATNDGPICVGGTVNLSANSTGATSWSWSGPSGYASTLQNPTATPTTTGTYSLMVSSTGNGCSPSTVYTTSVTVNAVPSSSGATNDGPICVGGTVNLSANSTGATSWSWSGPSGYASTLQNPTATPTTTGTYSLVVSSTGNGCSPSTVYTTSVTVNPLPFAITGASDVCVGSTTTLTNSGGGTWSSSNAFLATVGSSTGVVTGVAAGNVNVTYTLPTSCYITKAMTVNPVPSAVSITGASSACEGGSATLTPSTSGGVWTGGNAAIATINSSGVVSAIGTGVVAFTYSITNGFGCTTNALQSFTVNPVPATSAGDSAVCVGGNISLSNGLGGGTWSSSNSATATVGSATGVVSGAASGTVNISYTISATGCYSTKSLTVNPALPAITGTVYVCLGSTTTLANAASGGTWSSSAPSRATVGSATGVVTGVAVGASVISYTISQGCVATSTVSVLNISLTISGGLTVCAGATSSLSSASTGGTWASGNTSIATVNTTTGVMAGVSAGTANITYTSGSCFTTVVATVNAMPDTIGGIANICAGSTLTLTHTVSGGSWSSSNASVATVGSSSGVLNGVAPGTANVTYTLATGCYRLATVTIGATPAAISGNLTLCPAGTVTLTCSTGGGTWTSSNTSVATIGSASGVVGAAGVGNTTITYHHPGGCIQTSVVTVNSMPDTSLGINGVCTGGSVTLTNASSGGIWTSGSPSLLSVGSASGVVTGIAFGTANVTYTLSGAGCYTVKAMQVYDTLPVISGPAYICIGTSSALSHPVGGGTWSSSNTRVTVDATTGVVTGVAVGYATITYTVSSGCYKTISVYVPNIALNIYGTLNACVGMSTSLTCSSTGGTWTSSNVPVAGINATTGVMTGFSAGTATITYILAGCQTTRTATVDAGPASITGTSSVCAGSTATLSSATAGGSWSSGNITRATVGSASGVVTGVSAGTVYITYTLGSGCRQVRLLTVGAMPAAIAGTTSTCTGSSTVLSCSTAGGTWSSSNTAVATVSGTSASTSTTVSGVSAGTAIVSYAHSGGCTVTTTVTVAAPAPSNTGDSAVCVGGTVSLANSTSGGTWISSNATRASVGSATGIVTGVSVGTARITYILPSGCYSTTQVTVSSGAAAIAGASRVCVGFTTTLTHAVSGGSWSSSNTARATVDGATGVVTGISAGPLYITYAAGAGCIAVKYFYVDNIPSAITGTHTVCEGSPASLYCMPGSAGTWSSSDTTKARVTNYGLLTGISTGTSTISYTNAAGCYVTHSVTVNLTPAPITGPADYCVESAATFSCTTTGGIWTSTNSTVTSIDSVSGEALGLAGGIIGVRYVMPTGCFANKVVTVNVLPGGITGNYPLCVGNSLVLASSSYGATWSASDSSAITLTTLATNTVTINALSAGTVTVSYTNAAGCARSVVMSINAAVPANTGVASICVGNAAPFSNSLSGGTWSSSAYTKASVNSTTGVVTGVALGTANITYTISAGCRSVSPVTVNASTGTLYGYNVVCPGESVTFVSADAGGTWSSANTSIAAVDGSGIVTGVSGGVTAITYSLSAGCYNTRNVTVKASPVITGASSVPVGSTIALSATPTGGTWASSASSVAIVNYFGTVSGIATGSAYISYTYAGCVTTWPVTVTSLGSRMNVGSGVDLVKLYPNPNSGIFQLETAKQGVLGIVDSRGGVVLRLDIAAGVVTIELPVNLANGTYICNYTSSDGESAWFSFVLNR